LNIDIVVNKINVEYLPKMIQFFLKLGIYEYDVLQIIPFGRGFDKHKDALFYKIEEYLPVLHETWRFSKLP
jgi:MoaA/NifB/PqqE/SkfB family radical SAM enzyme